LLLVHIFTALLEAPNSKKEVAGMENENAVIVVLDEGVEETPETLAACCPTGPTRK
jgi:putative radical SAM-modified peptide